MDIFSIIYLLLQKYLNNNLNQKNAEVCKVELSKKKKITKM